MLLKATVLWVAGLVTLVPYGTYYLLFEASRDQYAILIVLILAWIFGYWTFVGVILMAKKVRAVFRAIETAGSRTDLERALSSPDARDVVIDLIATENHIPRFLASRVYDVVLKRMSRNVGAVPAERK